MRPIYPFLMLSLFVSLWHVKKNHKKYDKSLFSLSLLRDGRKSIDVEKNPTTFLLCQRISTRRGEKKKRKQKNNNKEFCEWKKSTFYFLGFFFVFPRTHRKCATLPTPSSFVANFWEEKQRPSRFFFFFLFERLTFFFLLSSSVVPLVMTEKEQKKNGKKTTTAASFSEMPRENDRKRDWKEPWETTFWL